jgi:hypothetical protein
LTQGQLNQIKLYHDGMSKPESAALNYDRAKYPAASCCCCCALSLFLCPLLLLHKSQI